MSGFQKTAFFCIILLVNISCSNQQKASNGLADLPVVRLNIDESAYARLVAKRDSALDNGVLLTSSADYIPVKVLNTSGDTLEGMARLKGDWTDHLTDPTKWSFRVKLKDGATVNGMRKFSLQHPKTRGYVNERLAHQLLKSQGLMALQYDFIRCSIQTFRNGQPVTLDLGIYAMEEAFDQSVITHNERQGGVLLKLDEDRLWEDRYFAFQVSDTAWERLQQPDFQRPGPATIFGQKKALKDKTNRDQALLARSLLEGYAQHQLPASEVFDVKKLALFNALLNLLGADHGVIWHNLRFYYNPSIQRLEPVAFDMDAGKRVNKLRTVIHAPNDVEFSRHYAQILDSLSQPEHVNYLIPLLSAYINAASRSVMEAYPEATFDPEVIRHNAKYIRKYLNVQGFSQIHLVAVAETSVILDVQNESRLVLELTHIGIKGKDISYNFPDSSRFVLPGKRVKISVPINGEFHAQFPKGFDKYQDYEALYVESMISGLQVAIKNKLIPFGQFDINEHKRLKSKADQQ